MCQSISTSSINLLTVRQSESQISTAFSRHVVSHNSNKHTKLSDPRPPFHRAGSPTLHTEITSSPPRAALSIPKVHLSDIITLKHESHSTLTLSFRPPRSFFRSVLLSAAASTVDRVWHREAFGSGYGYSSMRCLDLQPPCSR